ncbi:MAG: hypothetical protein M1831_005969 [Alyxoria varia]|nr:MAG: hypothetical protein M1831_005969 [Alyxoria varia]
MGAPPLDSLSLRRASLPVYMESRSQPEVENSSTLDQLLLHPPPHGHLETFVHATCGRCHHWHDAIPKTVPRSPEVHVDIKCEKCGMNMFGLGRRSTHLSHLSQESRASWNKDHGLRQYRWTCANTRFQSQDSSQISPHTSRPEPLLRTSHGEPTAQVVQKAETGVAFAQPRDVEHHTQSEEAQASYSKATQRLHPRTSPILKLTGRMRSMLGKRPKFLESGYRRFGELVLRKEVQIRPRPRRPNDTQTTAGEITDIATARRVSGTVGEQPTHRDVTRYQQPNDDAEETATMPTSPSALFTVTESSIRREERESRAEGDLSPGTEILRRHDQVFPRRNPSSTRAAFINSLRQRQTREAMKTKCECTSDCPCLQHHPLQRVWGLDSTTAGSMDPQVASAARTPTSPSFPNQESYSPNRSNNTGVLSPIPAPTPRGSAFQRHMGAGTTAGFGSHSEHRDSGTNSQTARSRARSGVLGAAGERHNSVIHGAPSS